MVIETKINIKEYEEYFKNQGNKEYILWFLYDKIESPLNIDKKLNLSERTTLTIISRNPSFFELDHKELNKKFWKLSVKGKTFIENEIKEKIELENQQLIQAEAKREEIKAEDYEDFFREIIKYLNLKKQILTNEILTLDFKEMSEINPSLCDKFLDDYENFKKRLIFYISEKCDKEMVIRPINLPNSLNFDLTEISSTKHLNKLIRTKAVIEYRSDTKEGIYTESKFECPSCGTIIRTIHHGDSYREPKRCSCGRRAGFKLISDEISDFLEIIVRSKDITKTKIRIHVQLQGADLIDYLNKNLGNGKTIEIIGVYKAKQKYDRNKKTNKFTGYIFAENIKATDEELFIISEKDKKQFKKITDDIKKNGLNNLIKTIFPSSINVCIGQEVLSKGWILQMVSGRNIYINGVKERRKPHIFCFGDPATDKSRKISYVRKIDPKIKDVNGASTSSAGLLLGMDMFENKRFVSGGILAEANNSIVIIDEISKFDKEARGSLHDVLASQRLKYNKVGFNIEEDVDISMSFFGNPPKDVFTNEPIYKQIRNPKDDFGVPDSNIAFLSRCDLVIGIRDVKSRDKEIIKIKLDKSNKGSEKQDDLIKKYIYYAKTKINPTLTKKSQKLLEEILTKLRLSVRDETLRVIETYEILSRCFAKLRLSEKVEEIDVLRTHKLYMDSLKSLEIDIKPEIENVKISEK